MRGPHSYTGEDTVEISCHASPYVIQQLLLNIIDKGARQAGPGEYTMRAFLNGKMDLSRAEAVADLIASGNEASHRLAMSQLKGGFSRQLNDLREKLLKLTTLMELELDFGEEDVQELKRDFAALRARLDQIPEEREKEIAVIERHYSNPRSLTFPAAVLFLVPETKAWGCCQ
jgi:tRNA modification GTPase